MKQVDLRTARERAGFATQTELADRSGIDISTISRLEGGVIKNPSNATVQKLEQTLRLRRGMLAFGADADVARAS